MTASGKGLIANELGFNACQSRYRIRYIPVCRTVQRTGSSEDTGKITLSDEAVSKDSSCDPWRISFPPASDQKQRDLLELMEYRCDQVSTIFRSQLIPGVWHERLGGSALADSIFGSIVPSAYIMRIDGAVSMRQRERVIKN